LVRIQVRLVSAPILVSILVPIVLIRVAGAPILLVWSEKKRAGVRKGVP
jgi:hypothetical protein